LAVDADLNRDLSQTNPNESLIRPFDCHVPILLGLAEFPDRARGRRRPRSAGGEENENDDEQDWEHDDETEDDDEGEESTLTRKWGINLIERRFLSL
jgi:hypothetical protein